MHKKIISTRVCPRKNCVCPRQQNQDTAHKNQRRDPRQASLSHSQVSLLVLWGFLILGGDKTIIIQAVMKTTISLAQMNIKQGDVEANFSSVLTYIDKAATLGSELLLLPELWSSGYDLVNRSEHHRKNQRILPELLKAAQKQRMWIGGSWIEEDHGDFFNTFVLINSHGEIACKYSKIHLFGLMDEPQWFKGGGSVQVTDFPWGKAGMAICYDLRFPELFRSYGLEGLPATLLVAQWPARRIDHWEILLKARAIENQMYMVAVNSVGQIGNEIFGGKSMVINPWGETLIEGSAGHPSLLTTEIDLDEVQRFRKSMPVFKDRRPEVYNEHRQQ